MPSSPNEDLGAATAICLVGILVPVVVAAAFQDLLTLYLTGAQFVLVAAVAFGLVAWVLLEELDLDRPNFLLASVVVPVIVVGGLIVYALIDPWAEVVRYLLGSAFEFTGPFMAAGAGAVGLSKTVREVAGRGERIPAAQVVVAGIGLVVVLAVAANLAAASSVSVAAVEQGTVDHRDPALNVTVEGPTAELRVTAVAPDGTSVTKRLSRADMRGGGGTAAVRVRADDSPPPGTLPLQAGTYRVRVTSLSGVTVDTATFTTEEGPAVSITDTETATGDLTWDDPPEKKFGTTGHETKIGVVVKNGGVFHSIADVELVTPEDRSFHRVYLAPGESVGVVLSLSDDTVEAIRTEGDGTVTVNLNLASGETVATETVELPD